MVQHKSNRENFNLQGSQSTDAVSFRPIRPHQCGYREINFVATTGIEPGTLGSPGLHPNRYTIHVLCLWIDMSLINFKLVLLVSAPL